MKTRLSLLLAGGAAVVAFAAAPSAVAASADPCFNAGASTQCQTPGNVQIDTGQPNVAANVGSVYGPFFNYDRGHR